MSESQVFRISEQGVSRLEHQPFGLEKDLQRFFEANLSALLGVRFLASEMKTDALHGGRIDTVGLDENNNPVVIEYKRDRNENVINQGLFYLDWLVNHQADFRWLVLQKIDETAANKVDWSSPRLICVAESYGKYDAYAVKQMNRDIQLVQYRRFPPELLVLDLITDGSLGRMIASTTPEKTTSSPSADAEIAEVRRKLGSLSAQSQDLFAALEAFIFSLGADIELRELKLYFAFRKLKNFVCCTPAKDYFYLWLKLDPLSIDLGAFAALSATDVSNTEHWGTGDLQLKVRSLQDLETAKPLLERAYLEN